MHRILVTGALGQIGSELVPALRSLADVEHVVASDIRMPTTGVADGPFEYVDCTHLRQIESVVRHHRIDTIYHLAALLSAVAEERPRTAWDVNTGGLYRVLEVARQNGCAVFHPSSIGAFGPTTPKHETPQDTIQRPTTMYGVTKVSAELLCDYYASRFGLDTRGLRLPGLISALTPPGGGTTDYAVEAFSHAVRHRRYTCYLRADTRLDMMYMPDAVGAMIDVMQADPSNLRHRNAFNVTAMSITPSELATAIRSHLPDFVIDYRVDPVRQAIADSWPQSVDDQAARDEWGWRPRFDLTSTTADMIRRLTRRESDSAGQAEHAEPGGTDAG